MIEKGNSKYKRFIRAAFAEVRRVLRPYLSRFSKKVYTQHQHAVAILLMNAKIICKLGVSWFWESSDDEARLIHLFVRVPVLAIESMKIYD